MKMFMIGAFMSVTAVLGFGIRTIDYTYGNDVEFVYSNHKIIATHTDTERLSYLWDTEGAFDTVNEVTWQTIHDLD